MGDVKQSADKLLATVIDTEENFNFKLYIHVPTRIHRIQLFEETSSKVMLVSRPLALAKFFLAS